MRNIRTAAVAIAALGTVGFLAAGTAHAGGGGGNEVLQSSNCRSHDLNVDVIGELGILNGALGDALNGEGDPGAQNSHLGSTMGCNSSAW